MDQQGKSRREILAHGVAHQKAEWESARRWLNDAGNTVAVLALVEAATHPDSDELLDLMEEDERISQIVGNMVALVIGELAKDKLEEELSN
jgi:hypothetical protein